MSNKSKRYSIVPKVWEGEGKPYCPTLNGAYTARSNSLSEIKWSAHIYRFYKGKYQNMYMVGQRTKDDE